MGHTISKQTIPTETFSPEVEIVHKKQPSNFGEVRLVRDVKTGQEMYLKEVVCHDQESFNNQLAYYNTRFNNPHPNLVNVIGYTSDQQQAFCSENHTIKVYFDSLQRNMENELDQHMLLNQLFSEVELQLLCEHIITILSDLQKKEVAHREISPAAIIITEEAYKLCDPSSNGQKAANGLIKYALLGVRSLLAPELLAQIPTQDYEIKTNQYKADVFSLGATLLSLATLTRSEDLYDYENATLNVELLEKRIQQVESLYSPTFSGLVRELLSLEEKTRPDFVQLSDRFSISQVIRAYNEKAQVTSYAKVPYVKIVHSLTNSEVNSPATVAVSAQEGPVESPVA